LGWGWPHTSTWPYPHSKAGVCARCQARLCRYTGLSALELRAQVYGVTIWACPPQTQVGSAALHKRAWVRGALMRFCAFRGSKVWGLRLLSSAFLPAHSLAAVLIDPSTFRREMVWAFCCGVCGRAPQGRAVGLGGLVTGCAGGFGGVLVAPAQPPAQALAGPSVQCRLPYRMSAGATTLFQFARICGPGLVALPPRPPAPASLPGGVYLGGRA
jgi:hypothetical protein